jgi:predicted dehydrogenase
MQPEVIGAYCPTLQREMEAEDLGLALLRFPNGAGGVIQGTTLADPGFPMTVTLCGTRASLTVEANSAITLRGADLPADLQDQPIGSTGGAHDPMAIPDEDHAANIDEFARAVLDGRDPTINGEEARKAVQLLNDIYRAAGVGPWAAVARTP